MQAILGAEEGTEYRKIRPRSRRRPLSATQHNPTTSLAGISFHCNETWRFLSSILTIFVTATHWIPITYKSVWFQYIISKGRKIK